MKQDKFVHGVAWILVGITLWATGFWIRIARTQDGFAGLAFLLVTAPWLAGALVLLGLLPSGYLYYKTKSRLNLWSLGMTGGSFLALLVETGALFFIPLRGC